MFDGDGYLKEGDVAKDPAEMKALFGAMKPSRIALEVGTHSPWVSALLRELGYEVIVANAREVRAISKSKKKNDKRMHASCAAVSGLVKSHGQRIRKCDTDSMSAEHRNPDRDQRNCLTLVKRDMRQMGTRRSRKLFARISMLLFVNHGSAELFLIEEIEAENPVLVAHGNRRPPGVERPLGANNLRIWIVQRRDVGEREVVCDLLLRG